LLAQKRTKKGSRSLGLPAADCPALLEKTGRCETRRLLAAQTVLALIRLFLCCSAA
jgi:hypothetical protein